MRRISNPPNPWSSSHIEWLGEPPPAELEVFEEEARSVLSANESPDVPFRWSVNPYRGCVHACAYCYARPTHQYLGWGAGTDFDRKIVVKVNSADVLRQEFLRPTWKGEPLVFSGVTDCYQALEGSYGLTRRLLEVCRDFRNPVGVITKGALVRRDIDLLSEIEATAGAAVYVSIPFHRDDVARKLEPFVSTPSQRFETLRVLSEAGIPTGVALAPIIPGLNDGDIPELLERAHQAGARAAFLTLLRLPAEVLPVFEARLQEAFPMRASRVWSAIEEVRGGKRNESRIGKRMAGVGPRWQAIRDLFDQGRRRLGMTDRGLLDRAGKLPFRRPFEQGTLFADLP